MMEIMKLGLLHERHASVIRRIRFCFKKGLGTSISKNGHFFNEAVSTTFLHIIIIVDYIRS